MLLKSPKLSLLSIISSKMALKILFLSSFAFLGCSDDEVPEVNELGQLKIELDSSNMNSSQAFLAEQIKKGVDNKDVLLQAFVGMHLEIYKRQKAVQKTLSEADIIDQIKKISGETSHLFELKKNMETTLRSEYGTLVYNRDMVNLLNYLEDGRMQCYSGTSLFEVLRQVNTPKSISKDQFVVIYERGHVLPGYVESKGDGYHLVGIESTVDGSGRKQYGSVKSLQDVRVVDADFFMAIEVLESVITNKQDVVDRALEITAQRYGIDLNGLEKSLEGFELYPYKGGVTLNADLAFEENEKLKIHLNSSLFQFGLSGTPSGEIARATIEDIQPGFRGDGVSLGEGVQIVEEYNNPVTLIPVPTSPLSRPFDASLVENIMMRLFQKDCMSSKHILRREIGDKKIIAESERPRRATCVQRAESSAYKCSVRFEIGFREFLFEYQGVSPYEVFFTISRLYILQGKNDSMKEVIENSTEASGILFRLSDQNKIISIPVYLSNPHSTIPAQGCSLDDVSSSKDEETFSYN
jgi:hypothetical protein